MVTSIIITFIYFVVAAALLPLRLLPDASLPSFLEGNVAQAGQYVAIIAQVIPIPTLLTVIAFFITIEIAIVSYKVIMWLIRRIPTQS